MSLLPNGLDVSRNRCFGCPCLIGMLSISLLLVGRVETSVCDAGEVAAATSVDLRPVFERWSLPVRAQGKRGTCSVFAVAGALEYALAKKADSDRSDTVMRVSVEFLNWASNQAVGQQEDGSFFSDLWKGFEKYGVCSEEEMPYHAQFDPQRKPSEAARTHARELQQVGLQLHWIKPWDPHKGLTDRQLAVVKDTMRHGWPVCGGFLWPKQARWVDGVLQMAPRDRVRDGHSVLLVGFRDDPAQPGGGVFVVRDSGQGRQGHKMSYEYVKTYMNDAVWIGIRPAAAPQ